MRCQIKQRSENLPLISSRRLLYHSHHTDLTSYISHRSRDLEVKIMPRYTTGRVKSLSDSQSTERSYLIRPSRLRQVFFLMQGCISTRHPCRSSGCSSAPSQLQSGLKWGIPWAEVNEIFCSIYKKSKSTKQTINAKSKTKPHCQKRLDKNHTIELFIRVAVSRRFEAPF